MPTIGAANGLVPLNPVMPSEYVLPYDLADPSTATPPLLEATIKPFELVAEIATTLPWIVGELDDVSVIVEAGVETEGIASIIKDEAPIPIIVLTFIAICVILLFLSESG